MTNWTTEQLARLAQLSAEFLDLEPDERQAWLERVQSRNPDLAGALPAMAATTTGVASADLPPLTLTDEADFMPLLPGDSVGAYRLVRLLGRGGMGVVWLAEQVDGRVQRQVALKLLAPQWAKGAWRVRFERERDILSALSHPGIARLIDAGVSAQGCPFLVMDFINGQDIVSHARERTLGPRDCVGLILSLLDAIQHAHASLVVHRDLKPSNVMVDTAGRIVLLDFGVAKMLRADESAHQAVASEVTSLTGVGLTLDYASPEQVAGRPIGVSTDIYSAGVLLYELLAGQRPYRLRRDTRAAMEEAILEHDLKPPSQRVDARWAQRLGWQGRRLSRQLRGDLDAVVLKALQRDPAQRYANASEFAADLQRWLDGRPVRAQPPSRWYVTRRLLLRHRWVVVGSALTLTGLSTGLAAALWQADLARTEARTALATEAFLIDLFKANGLSQDAPAVAQATTARMLLERGTQRIASGQADGLEAAPSVRLRLIDTLIKLNADLGMESSVDDLQQQRLALIRQHHGDEPGMLASALVAAGRAASAGNSRVDQAPKLLDEAEQLMDKMGLPETAPMRGHLALGRLEVASEDQCKAWPYAQQAIDVLRPVAATDSRWIEALIAGTRSGAYCGPGEQALALAQEALVWVKTRPEASSHAAMAHYAASLALSRMGRLGDSIKESRISFEMARDKHPADRPVGADALNAAADLADKYCEYAHPADAEALSLSLMNRIGPTPADLDAAVSLMARHARALRQLSRMPEALAVIDKALGMMRGYEVDPAQRALVLDIQADALSAAGRLTDADRVFEVVARLKDEIHHTGTPQNYRHIARRVEHELRKGHVAQAESLMKQFDVKEPAPGKASRRHVEWLVLQGEIAWQKRNRALAEARAREALERLALLPEPSMVRDHKARALELLSTSGQVLDKGNGARDLREQAKRLRIDMAKTGFGGA